jgi:uncharacterized protein RhaS with RHS repeats
MARKRSAYLSRCGHVVREYHRIVFSDPIQISHTCSSKRKEPNNLRRLSLAISLLAILTHLGLAGRYFDARTGRFLEVDPNMRNYPAWSPYGYALNNPLAFIDPNGNDAVPIVFKDYKIQVWGFRLPYLGHAGVLLIDNKTGYTKYYEYGRYDQEGKGLVRTYAVPNVAIDSKTGLPTTESMNRVLAKISAKSGQGGDITGSYIKNDNFKEMNDFAKSRLEQNGKPDRTEYSILNNSCGTFVKDVMESGGVESPSIARPNAYIEEVREDHPKLDFDAQNKQTRIEEEKKNERD